MIAIKTPEQIKKEFRENSQYEVAVSDGLIGAIIGLMNRNVGGPENRRMIVGWLVDANKPVSSKELTVGQRYALSCWCGAHVDEETGKWESGEYFQSEALLCLTEAYKYYINKGVSVTAQMPLSDSLISQAIQVGGHVVAITNDSEVVESELTEVPEGYIPFETGETNVEEIKETTYRKDNNEINTDRYRF